jgi:hypothetical protein
MKRTLFASLVTALALSFAAPITADAQRRGAEKEDDKRVKTYDFSGDTLEGDLVKPDGENIDTRNFASHSSLIRIRTDFIREILKSAEDL